MSEKTEVQKGNRDAEILTLVQSFAKSMTDLLTKKEEPAVEKKFPPKEEKPDEEKKAAPVEKENHPPEVQNNKAQEELSHGPCSAKKAEKCSGKDDPEEVEKAAPTTADITKMVEDQVKKALENMNLPTEKKSLSPAALTGDIAKKDDPLAMDLRTLNLTSPETIAKRFSN